MTMGPFTIVKTSDDQYQINDRWCDPAAVVDTHEHGQAWIELFYKALNLQNQFLGVNSHAVQTMEKQAQMAAAEQRERNKQALAESKGRPKGGKPRGIRKTRQLQLSCGAKVYVDYVARAACAA